MKALLKEIQYCLNNYIINHIPFWPLRLMLYRAQGLRIGNGSRILMGTRILSPSMISIGNHSYINEYCYLDGRGGIKIGDNVTIAVYSKIISGSHDVDDALFSYRADSITINSNSVVFANCVVLGGANLEEGCVISASSLVRKGNYCKKGIYAGNPARFIRQRRSDCKYVQDSWHPMFR